MWSHFCVWNVIIRRETWGPEVHTRAHTLEICGEISHWGGCSQLGRWCCAQRDLMPTSPYPVHTSSRGLDLISQFISAILFSVIQLKILFSPLFFTVEFPFSLFWKSWFWEHKPTMHGLLFGSVIVPFIGKIHVIIKLNCAHTTCPQLCDGKQLHLLAEMPLDLTSSELLIYLICEANKYKLTNLKYVGNNWVQYTLAQYATRFIMLHFESKRLIIYVLATIIYIMTCSNLYFEGELLKDKT